MLYRLSLLCNRAMPGVFDLKSHDMQCEINSLSLRIAQVPIARLSCPARLFDLRPFPRSEQTAVEMAFGPRLALH